MKILKKVCIVIIVVCLVALVTINSLLRNDSNFIIKEWDNIYNTNSINFYYEDIKNTKLQSLEQLYNIKEVTKDENTDLEKAREVVQLVNNIVEVDSISNSKFGNGYDIIREKKDSLIVSKRDMAIITRDMLNSIGLVARLGEFRNPATAIEKQGNYFVVEYYSEEFSKWIMLDYLDMGYFLKEEIPLSAIEILNEDVKNINYKGHREKKEYYSSIKSYLKTYSIWIDNTIEMKRSNTQLTFVKKDKYITLDFKNIFLPPTIFTQNPQLFNKKVNDYNIEADDRAYIVLMKKEDVKKEEGEEPQEETIDFICGGYKEDKILIDYYVRVNDGEFKEVKRYTDFKLKTGLNKLEISLNGIDIVSAVTIEVKNK